MKFVDRRRQLHFRVALHGDVALELGDDRLRVAAIDVEQRQLAEVLDDIDRAVEDRLAAIGACVEISKALESNSIFFKTPL